MVVVTTESVSQHLFPIMRGGHCNGKSGYEEGAVGASGSILEGVGKAA